MLLPFVREAQPTAGARGWAALHHQEPQPALGAPSVLPLSCTGQPVPPARQEPVVPKAGKTFPPSLSHLCCMSAPLWSPRAWIWACRAPPETQWKVQDVGFRLLEEEEPLPPQHALLVAESPLHGPNASATPAAPVVLSGLCTNCKAEREHTRGATIVQRATSLPQELRKTDLIYSPTSRVLPLRKRTIFVQSRKLQTRTNLN